jgi:hypothetical protein
VNERRISTRVSVALDVHLTRKVGNAVTVRTSDLSSGGALVVSSRPLRIYEEMHFDLDLPAGGPHVDGTARVLRQHRHDTYALRFERIAPATATALSALVDAGTPAPDVRPGRP